MATHIEPGPAAADLCLPPGNGPGRHMLHVDTGADPSLVADGSASRPFRSLRAALAVLSPGGKLRLRAGCVVREALCIETAGITVEPYGEGLAPRLSGGVLVGPDRPWQAAAALPAAFARTPDEPQEAGGLGPGPPIALWYLEAVEEAPLIVTLDGLPGRHCGARALLAREGDYWWDAWRQRLYLCSTEGGPARRWHDIEYAARRNPVQVAAAFVSLHGLVISHHNLDDGRIGIAAGRHAGTLALPGIIGLHNAAEAADHLARPGRADSPWNRPLDGRARYAPAPTGFGELNVVLGGWLSPPITTAIHIARQEDPVVEVLYHPDVWLRVREGRWARNGNPPSLENAILAQARPDFPATPHGGRSRYVYQTSAEPGWHLPDPPAFHPSPPPPPGTALRVRCPAGVVPPPDTDGYLAVFQPDGSVFEAYCPVLLSRGQIICFSYGITNPGGDLSGSEGGVCASLIPVYAGAIRDGEIAAGAIPHAIAAYAPETQLAKAARWPALAWDRTNNYRGSLPMGARLAIPPSMDLARLAFRSAAGRGIARACQDHGLIIVDRNGGDGLVLKTQHNTVRDSAVLGRYNQALWQDLRGIVARLQVVQG